MRSRHKKSIGSAIGRGIEIARVLRRKLGPKIVLNSKEEIESHSFDALRHHRGYALPEKGFPPDLVVTPSTTKQLTILLEVARQFGIPLTPRGAGTGLMGGAVALRRPGIVIDFRKMNKVLKVNKKDQSVVVQPGATMGSVNRVLKSSRLMLGHDPWTRDYATVGGSISTNGMGYYGGRYGSMGEQVLGLKGVLANGTKIQTPAVPYSSTGFDLRRLFIGTEGTLGLLIEATLRCFPIPKAQEIMGFSFPTFEIAFKTALRMRDEDLSPASMDIMCEGYAVPCEFYVLFAGSPDAVKASVKRCLRLFSSLGGTRLESGKARSYWKERHNIADMYVQGVSRSPLSSFREDKSFDFVHVGLAASKIIPFKRKISELARRRRITIEEYGTWIKPELFNFNFTRERGVPAENLRRTVDDSMKLAIKLGGTIEYCHGSGFRLAGLLPLQHGEGLEIMRRIKQELDPQMILNPGKLGLSMSRMRRQTRSRRSSR